MSGGRLTPSRKQRSSSRVIHRTDTFLSVARALNLGFRRSLNLRAGVAWHRRLQSIALIREAPWNFAVVLLNGRFFKHLGCCWVITLGVWVKKPTGASTFLDADQFACSLPIFCVVAVWSSCGLPEVLGSFADPLLSFRVIAQGII